MRIEINACRFLVKMAARESQGYVCMYGKNNSYIQITWDEVLKWLDRLEEFYETKI